MRITREDVMYYCGLVAAFTALLAGITFDMKMFGTTAALSIISGVNLLIIGIAYLRKEK